MVPRRSGYRSDAITARSEENAAIRDVDPETLDFIQKYLTSYTKWEVLKYFAENPSAVESVRGFARRLNKDQRQISEALTSLARSGIVGNGKGPEEAGYSLTADASQKATLQKIADSAKANNRFRLLLNYHITKASLAKYKSRI
ncbi:MAG TPA: hypothetical protein VHS28_08200 [Chloroflexota bacterium]|nr:hypothetical protein [Chloroflexota bacterium]